MGLSTITDDRERARNELNSRLRIIGGGPRPGSAASEGETVHATAALPSEKKLFSHLHQIKTHTSKQTA